MLLVVPALAKRLSLALGVSALAALSGPAASFGQTPTQDSVAGSASAKPCRPKGSTTVTKSRLGRIYKLQTPGNVPDFYGCLYSRGKAYLIGERNFCDVAEPGDFRLAGRYVAYSLPYCNIDQRADQVRVLDLKTGKQLVATSASPSLEIVCPCPVYVTDMELKANGSVAWIVKLRPRSTPSQAEVRKSDRKLGTGERKTSKLVDSGQLIASHSLTREGSTISWTNAGIEKTATLR